jgi:hypothetical protein
LQFKQFKSAIFCILIVVSLLAGCTGEAQVAERESYWSKKAGVFFDTEPSLEDLHHWLRDNDRYYTFDESEIVDGEWNVALETVRVETIVCESWTIFLEVTIDKDRNISDYKITKQGACLY